MWCCYRSNISHAAITNLNSVLVEYLMKNITALKCSFTSFKNVWHGCSTVSSSILQPSLARLFNSHWNDCPTVTGTILQRSLARFFLFFMLAEFFNSDVHCWRMVPCTRNTTHDAVLIIATPFSMFFSFPYFHIFHIFHFLFRACGKRK